MILGSDSHVGHLRVKQIFSFFGCPLKKAMKSLLEMPRTTKIPLQGNGMAVISKSLVLEPTITSTPVLKKFFLQNLISVSFNREANCEKNYVKLC